MKKLLKAAMMLLCFTMLCTPVFALDDEINPEVIGGELNLNIGEIYLLEDLQVIFKPLIDENIGCFTEVYKNTEVSYGGVKLFGNSSKTELENVQPSRLSNFTILVISFIASSLMYGLYLAVKSQLKKSRNCRRQRNQ